MSAASRITDRPRRGCLLVLLVVAYGLRVWLNLEGGHYFWPDEMRYSSSQNAAYEFFDGHWKNGFAELAGHADHAFFRWASLPAAVAELKFGHGNQVFSSLYFSLFSTGVILLVWAVARRSGAGEEEALWAAFFSAACNGLLFYSRHFLPYDISLFLMFWALWASMGEPGRSRSFFTGVIVGFGFLTYNGYWLLGGTVLVLHTLLGPGGYRRAAARGAFAAVGLVVPIATFVGLGALASRGILSSYRVFAASVKQGDFGIGYAVIGRYLWSAEKGLLLVLLVGFSAAVPLLVRSPQRGRIALWFGAVVLLVGGLIFFSDVVPVFMVYGRLARVITPFLCLGAALGVGRIIGSLPRGRSIASAALAALVIILAAANFSVPIRQAFPDGFQTLAARVIRRDTVNGYSFYRMLNAETLWGHSLESSAQMGTVLLRRANPLQFEPYQFEGYSAAQRASIARNDLAMMLVKLPIKPGNFARWDGYPGPVELELTFPRGKWGLAEPLVVSGQTGIGDTFFVRYEDSSHIVFGLDHWGEAVITSGPLWVDYGVPHKVLISGGFLMPPAGSGAYSGREELSLMREHLLVQLDGRTVVSTRAQFYPSSPRTIYFGAAVIGGSTTEPSFSGSVANLAQAPFGEVEGAIPVVAYQKLLRERAPDWMGALGPVRMEFILPPDKPGLNEGQPLLSIVDTHFRAVLFLVRRGLGRAQVGLDVLGSGAIWSEDVPLAPTGVERAEICVGSLLPDVGAPVYGHAPNFVQMRRMVYVRLNGQVALFAPVRFPPSGHQRVVFGANIPGSSAAARFFQGEVTSLQTLDLTEVPVGLNALVGPISDLSRPGWEGYPGPLRMEIAFAPGLPGDAQPILTTGVIGAGDFVFVRYERDSTARICIDHWGHRLIESAPFALEPGKVHTLRLSLGSLFPPPSSELFVRHPELAAKAHGARVELDGRSILETGIESHPNRPEWITLGSNFIGGSSVGAAFLGTLGKVTRDPLEGEGR